MSPRTVLVVDAGGHPLEPVAQRLRLLGIAALRAKTAAEAHSALADPRAAIGAVLIPPDPPALDLPRALRALTKAPDGGVLPLLVCGPRPEPEARARLREAGAELALWEPLDDHTLRFQVNRALAQSAAVNVPRHALRVPAHWPVQVRMGARTRPAHVYSVSARGAFLATPGPALRRSLVHVTLPLADEAGERLRLACEVVATNVPGNLRRRNLPLGMGVRFLGLGPGAERTLQHYADERARDLCV
jgi:CheY-like chemotaxis protein